MNIISTSFCRENPSLLETYNQFAFKTIASLKSAEESKLVTKFVKFKNES